MLLPTDIFHVHTFRCKHADFISDEAYIQKAIELGATGIWFTDHAPFPGNPFRNRMEYAELDEYISTLLRLKRAYTDRISVHIGLEIEYFPSFTRYYEELNQNRNIEILLLGQHMAEDTEGSYTYSWEKERLKKEEYVALGKATISGIQSGFFHAVAHPDRLFRRCKAWDDGMQTISKEIIRTAQMYNIPLEINISSMKQKMHFWSQFWNLVPSGVQKITGIDAHSIDELECYKEGIINESGKNNKSTS